MTKSKLINTLAEKQPHLLKHDIESALNRMLEQSAEALVRGDRIEIRGFISFSLHSRAPRTGRNPKTGKSAPLPAKVAIHFKPGKEMRDRVNASRESCGIRSHEN